MINIHPKLISIIDNDRGVDDTKYKLAYMTHREYKKHDGTNTESYDKRLSTGENWADLNSKTIEFDNKPKEGFKIIGSVSRWSTNNKLIRVEDPRGFVVEVPTGNLTTLLKHCLVDHGVVIGECIWGREGSNHILIPIDSEVYKQANNKINEKNNMISFTKLKAGDVVRFSVDGEEEWVYIGRAKASWEIQQKQATKQDNNHYRYSYCEYRASLDDETISVFDEHMVDTKPGYVFKVKPSAKKHYGLWQDFEYKASGKCVLVSSGGDVPSIERFEIYIPERVMNNQSVLGRRDMHIPNSDGVYIGFTTRILDIKKE